MNFDAEADELQRRVDARFAAAMTPRPEQLRSMTVPMLRTEAAALWEALGHTIVTPPDAAELIHVMDGHKYITLCGNPVELQPANASALRRLRDRVVASCGVRGFYISVRGFTAEARHFANTAPVQLLDCERFIQVLGRVRKKMKISPEYPVKCRCCGAIVQHSLDDSTAKPCVNGHTVPQPRARADFEKASPGGPAQSVAAMLARVVKLGRANYLAMSPKAARRQAIRAHNRRRWRDQASQLPYRGGQ